MNVLHACEGVVRQVQRVQPIQVVVIGNVELKLKGRVVEETE